MSNILSTIFITEETFPFYTLVKNAIPNSLRGFTWYVERTPEGAEVEQLYNQKYKELMKR